MFPKLLSSACSSSGDMSRNVYPLLSSTCRVMSSPVLLSVMEKSCIGGTYPFLVCTVLLSTNSHVESG